jgi:hypothetical protein
MPIRSRSHLEPSEALRIRGVCRAEPEGGTADEDGRVEVATVVQRLSGALVDRDGELEGAFAGWFEGAEGRLFVEGFAVGGGTSKCRKTEEIEMATYKVRSI